MKAPLYRLIRKRDGAVYSDDKRRHYAGWNLGGEPVLMTRKVFDRLVPEGNGLREKIRLEAAR